MSLLRAYWPLVRGRRMVALALAGLQGVSGLLEGVALAAVMPLLQAGSAGAGDSVVDRLLARVGVPPSATQTVALAGFLGLGVLSVVLRYAFTMGSLRLRAGVERRMRERLTGALLRMHWPAFLGVRMGDVSKAVLLEGQQSAAGLWSLLQAAGAALVAGVFLVLAVVLSPTLTAFTCAFGVLGGLGYRVAARKAKAHAERASEVTAEIGDQVATLFGSLKLFRSTGDSERAEQEIRSVYSEYARRHWSAYLPGYLMRALFEAGGLLLVGAILTLTLARTGALAPESLVFMAVFYRLAPRLLAIQEALQSARVQLPWLRAWQERLDLAESAVDHHPGTREPSFMREIRAEGVSFSYPGSDAVVLEDVDWVLRRGECIAFVGESGGGKTTMLDLVTGLLTPTAGAILVDGVSLQEFDRRAWQRRLGFVPQEPPLFHASVEDNIAWGSGPADLDRVWRCARMAHADGFIQALPDGMHTVIGERGGRLSGGQRQRLALARALYREPWLLLLDEPTSALDSDAEAVVQAALEDVRGHCSIVLVAHRLGTVRMADRIHVVERGAVVEQGSWDELLRQGGRFAALAAAQGIGGRG